MAYKSRYEEQLANALNKITSREKFNYDFNADPMYQAYKDQYTKLGNEAAANAAANVSALTGGYGNSYAATAAAQANQQYLTKLNEQIPALYQQALNKYMMEGDELNNTYQTLSDADTRDYSKYRDDIADEQWKQNFEEQIRQYNQNFTYNQSRDAIADQQWQAQFDENKRRYDQEWAASQAAQAAAQALLNSQKSGSSGGSNGGSGNTTASEALQGAINGALIGASVLPTKTVSNSAENVLSDAYKQKAAATESKLGNINTTKTGLTASEKALASAAGGYSKDYGSAVNEAVNIYKNSKNAGAGEQALNQAVANAVNKGIIPATEEAAATMKKIVINKSK